MLRDGMKCAARMLKSVCFGIAATVFCAAQAQAVSIELKHEAGVDRIERQRLASRGELPLPGTPDLSRLDARIAEAGFERNAAIYIRLFKDTSTLEIWMRKGDQFALFASYPICNWDGTIGPKLVEGDRQSPEGFYTVGEGQLRYSGRYHRAFDLNYPNLLDRVQGRSGSAILIHGACSTVGCFAMTNPVIEELFILGTRAMAGGQKAFAVHVFPFRMTEAALAARQSSQWADYWQNLKIGYDMFERSHLPPLVGVCNRRYSFFDARGPVQTATDGSAKIDYRCGMWMAGGGEVEAERVAALPMPTYAVPEIIARGRNQPSRSVQVASGPWRPSPRLLSFVSTKIAAAKRQPASPSRPVLVASTGRGETRRLGLGDVPRARAFVGDCNANLASCRKFKNLTAQRTSSRKKQSKVVAAARPRKATEVRRKKS
jgi:murein L,D-transpeptidase YafK